MSYVLESSEEFDRLERQSQTPAYDFRAELADLKIKDGARVLDAGCGSGLVTRYLSERYPEAMIEGCDVSAERIAQARAHAPGILFNPCDLTRTPFRSGTFDVIISRYVFQHLSPSKAGRALKELFRILKPKGKLILVDGDGLFVNLYPQPRVVRQALENLAGSKLVDFHIGRKLPHRMAEAGFESISWRLLTANHEGKARDTELQLMRERFEIMAPRLEKLLGRAVARRFVKSYLQTLGSPTAAYFTETFVVTGAKPPDLRLVKPDRK